MNSRYSLTLLCLTPLTGCAVNPLATQVEVASPQDALLQQKNSVATYYMQASRLDIAFKNTAEDGKPAKWAFTVANVPVEDTRRRFLLVHNSSVLSRTNLTAAKRQNTDLLSSIGSEVIDNRVTLIQNAAAVAKVAIGTLVSAAPPQTSAFTARFELTNADKFAAAESQLAGWSAWTHRDVDNLAILVGPPPVTAARYDRALLQRGLNGIYSAACRPVIVTYTAPNSVEYEWRGKLADADAVEFTVLPRKGKVEYHEQCGTSVTSDKDPTQTTDALVAAAVAQAVAVKEAYDKAKED